MYRAFFKRILDIVLSLLALPFFAIIFIIIAPLIYFEDKGPVFYNAPRVGRYGKTFTMYKFRSMFVNAPDIRNSDGTTYNSDHDPRVTKIGRFIRKTSLDETPQLINVLLGDMSLIGPRPDLASGKTYEELKVLYPRSHSKFTIRPGITGYTQAYYRNNIENSERCMKDAWYANNITFWLDIKIIFATVRTVLLHYGINRGELNTVSEEEAQRIVNEQRKA